MIDAMKSERWTVECSTCGRQLRTDDRERAAEWAHQQRESCGLRGLTASVVRWEQMELLLNGAYA